MIKDEVKPSSLGETVAMQHARTEIENLRRWYAVATDQLGQIDNQAAQDEGIATYHRIFTESAQVQVTGAITKALEGTGPDAWAGVVRNALKDYQTTQHLLGTQVVTFTNVSFAPAQSDGFVEFTSGKANMSSYLQAWHAWPDRKLRLVMGTYLDDLTYTPTIGWQIARMNLVHVSGEHRQLGTPS